MAWGLFSGQAILFPHHSPVDEQHRPAALFPVLAPADPGAVGAWAGRVLQPEVVQVMQMDCRLGLGQGVGCMAGQVMGKGEAQDRLQRLAQLGQGGGLRPQQQEGLVQPVPGQEEALPRPPPAPRPLGVPRQGDHLRPAPAQGKALPRFQRADRGLPPG